MTPDEPPQESWFFHIISVYSIRADRWLIIDLFMLDGMILQTTGKVARVSSDQRILRLGPASVPD